jgi:hypothetical protein
VKRFLLVALTLALVAGLAGCAPAESSSPTATESPTTSWPVIDPSLIPPAATADLPLANAADYLTSYSDYVFKIGTGPTWCSINKDAQFAICEQDEAATQYDPIPTPDSCSYSFGYQVKLVAKAPAAGKAAEFTCSGGYYADASKAKTLDNGYSIKVGDFTCYTAGQTARCDNAAGEYIVLGAKAWALGN